MQTANSYFYLSGVKSPLIMVSIEHVVIGTVFGQLSHTRFHFLDVSNPDKWLVFNVSKTPFGSYFLSYEVLQTGLPSRVFKARKYVPSGSIPFNIANVVNSVFSE